MYCKQACEPRLTYVFTKDMTAQLRWTGEYVVLLRRERRHEISKQHLQLVGLYENLWRAFFLSLFILTAWRGVQVPILLFARLESFADTY